MTCAILQVRDPLKSFSPTKMHIEKRSAVEESLPNLLLEGDHTTNIAYKACDSTASYGCKEESLGASEEGENANANVFTFSDMRDALSERTLKYRPFSVEVIRWMIYDIHKNFHFIGSRCYSGTSEIITL